MSAKPFNLVLFAGVAAVAIAAASKAQAALPNLSAQGTNVIAASTDIDTLARTIWGEARGGGFTGMQAVANVVMNRLAIASQYANGYWWGSSISEICTKHRGNTYQFSCWSPSDVNFAELQAVTPDDFAFGQALQIATMAIAGQLPDLTHGATNYYAPDLMPNPPQWADGQKAVASIGGNLFFQIA